MVAGLTSLAWWPASPKDASSPPSRRSRASRSLRLCRADTWDSCCCRRHLRGMRARRGSEGTAGIWRSWAYAPPSGVRPQPEGDLVASPEYPALRVPGDVLPGTTTAWAHARGSVVIRCWLPSLLDLLRRQQDAGSANAALAL